MNILPLIFTFLIILSLISAAFFKEVKSAMLSENCFEGFNRTERAVTNAIAIKNYRQLTKKTKTPSRKNSPQKKGIYHSRRDAFPLNDASKFNLSPLLRTDSELKMHPLYHCLAKLLRLLYGKSLFDKDATLEKIEYALLDALFKQAKKNPEFTDFSELYPEEAMLRHLFYKMLKGTNFYNRHQGIPPFEDFFYIDKKAKEISLSFASPLLLEALFGAEMTTLILQKEEKKWEETHKYYFFQKTDLQEIFVKNPSLSSSFLRIDPYIDYSKKAKAKHKLGGRDKKTSIGVEKHF